MPIGGYRFWCQLCVTSLLILSACKVSDPGASSHAGGTADAGHREDAHVPISVVDGSTAQGHDAGAPRESRWFLDVPDPLVQLPRGQALRDQLCARALKDPISEFFCRVPPVSPTSMVELLSALAIEPSTTSQVQGYAITAHSTALSKRFVSSINPRVVYARVQDGDVPPLSVAFTRGEPFVEAVAVDPERGSLEFYIIAFTLPCHGTDIGCGPANLLTPVTEAGWVDVDVYHERDLDNTTLDCAVCHQPQGPSAPKLLRMQELENTWTHWLFSHSQGGQTLTLDFMAAHGGEHFAGLPPDFLEGSRPSHLAELVRARGPFVQPNMFNSGRIEIEVKDVARDQPADNSVAGESETWRKVFEVAQRGEAIPVPYYNVKVTDAAKLDAMTTAYNAYRDGTLPAAQLPDIRDVFPDDLNRLVDMGFVVDDELRGQALLTAACALCHNNRLDQSFSRARFSSDLASLTRGQKDLAIKRLQLPSSQPGSMPPARIHSLTDSTRTRLINLLRM